MGISLVFHPQIPGFVFPRDELRIFPLHFKDTGRYIAWSIVQQKVEVRRSPGVKGKLIWLPFTLTFKSMFLSRYVSRGKLLHTESWRKHTAFGTTTAYLFCFPLSHPVSSIQRLRKDKGTLAEIEVLLVIGAWIETVANRDWRVFLRLRNEEWPMGRHKVLINTLI